MITEGVRIFASTVRETEYVQTLASRLPRMHQDIFRQQFANADTVILDNYPSLMPYLLAMDRAQVLALDADRQFYLAGVFASFPSDIDSELKRFGMRIGKFVYGDSEIYERNRMFVYQYLMELYGFPIVSERRTSSALFARKARKQASNFHCFTSEGVLLKEVCSNFGSLYLSSTQKHANRLLSHRLRAPHPPG